MTKLYTFLVVVSLLLFSQTSQAQLLLTEIVDGTLTTSYPRYVEITNTDASSVNLQNFKLKIYMNGGVADFTYTFPSYTLPAGASVVIANFDNSSTDQQWTDYNLIEPAYVVHGETNTIRGNGDDAYELINSSDVVIDVYGSQTTDGTGTAWDYEDSYAYRNLDIISPNTTFTLSEWTVAPTNTLDGNGSDLSPYLTPGYRALSIENDILSFSIPEQTNTATINATNHTIDIEVSSGADLSNLTPTITISESATIDPIGGESANFSLLPFIYTVTAQSGDAQAWEITVSQASSVSNENDILAFSFTEQTGAAIINDANHTVNIEVTNGTALTALVPTISISAAASINPLSGAAQDFSSAFIYTVTAENSDQQVWTITVTEEFIPSSENNILAFSFTEQTDVATIDNGNHTIDIEVTYGTNVSSLIPTIGISSNAEVNPNTGIAQDFTDPFIYTVTAEDNTPQEWIVTVSVATNIELVSEQINIRVYPNPVTEVLYIDNISDIKEIRIYNNLGKQIALLKGNNNTQKIDVSHLPSSVYYLQFINTKGQIDSKAFIKK